MPGQIQRLKNVVNRAIYRAKDIWAPKYQFDTLPPETIRAAAAIPFVRQMMVEFSLEEYDRNPYYQSVINNLSYHTVGPTPTIIGTSEFDDLNNHVEDAFLDWSSSNGIGWCYREIRKQAALTGLGIGVPQKHKSTAHPVNVTYKVYGSNSLITPMDALEEDRIIDGIQYDEDWDIERFHFKTDDPMKTDEWTVNEVIHWSHGYEGGIVKPVPECLAAFSIYPYIRRFLQAAVEGEEFRISMPMAIEVDPKVYGANIPKDAPKGKFEYNPKMIPTLPPGTKLVGMPSSISSSEKEKLIRLVASTCALCVSMPANLAVGDSSNSNMASAQIDIQPWKNKINIDRFDMEPMFRKSFMDWYKIAVLRRGFLDDGTGRIRQKYNRFFPHTRIYDNLFQHPDPLKNANARAVDLISGATTLNRIYAELGKNARRELDREATLLRIKPEELTTIILTSRSLKALEVLNGINEKEEANQAA